MGTRKVYSEEFKRDAVRLQETRKRSVGAIEQELGLSYNLLHHYFYAFLFAIFHAFPTLIPKCLAIAGKLHPFERSSMTFA